MNLKETILEEHSKARTERIVGWVGDDKERLRQLMNLFLHDEYRVVQRAAWAVSEVAEHHPALFAPYLPVIMDKLNETGAHPAVRRNIFRIFDRLELPEPLHGALLHHAFTALEDPQEALAVRAFAIGILTRLMKQYPEIVTPFHILLEDFLQQESAPSFKSRAAKALKQIDHLRKTGL